jgi:hypothetical protein
MGTSPRGHKKGQLSSRERSELEACLHHIRDRLGDAKAYRVGGFAELPRPANDGDARIEVAGCLYTGFTDSMPSK